MKHTFLVLGLSVLLVAPVARAAETKSEVEPLGYSWYYGCNPLGTWFSQWGSSTGWYSDWLTVQSYGNGFLGYYTNGYVTFFLDGLTTDGAAHYSGTWRRTAGSSGGPCQYGTADFTLRYTGDAYGSFPSCSLNGRWNYCSTPAIYGWPWNNSQTFY